MRSFIIASVLSIASLTMAQAYSGGPYGFGNPTPGAFDGTYKASVVGRGIIGILVFPQSGVEGRARNVSGNSFTTLSSGSGTAAIFARGIVYLGTTVASLEPATRFVGGVFYAQRPVISEGATVPSLQTNDFISGGFKGTAKTRGGATVVFTASGRAEILALRPGEDEPVQRTSVPIRVRGSRTSFFTLNTLPAAGT